MQLFSNPIPGYNKVAPTLYLDTQGCSNPIPGYNMVASTLYLDTTRLLQLYTWIQKGCSNPIPGYNKVAPTLYLDTSFHFYPYILLSFNLFLIPLPHLSFPPAFSSFPPSLLFHLSLFSLHSPSYPSLALHPFC